jgi:uncharacterized membrane protein
MKKSNQPTEQKKNWQFEFKAAWVMIAAYTGFSIATVVSEVVQEGKMTQIAWLFLTQFLLAIALYFIFRPIIANKLKK